MKVFLTMTLLFFHLPLYAVDVSHDFYTKCGEYDVDGEIICDKSERCFLVNNQSSLSESRIKVPNNHSYDGRWIHAKVVVKKITPEVSGEFLKIEGRAHLKEKTPQLIKELKCAH